MKLLHSSGVEGHGTVAKESSTADSLFQFNGKQFDTTVGLQFNMNRWHDPTIGQWISEEPVAFAGDDENFRRYVGTDPAKPSE
jgi:RHS repeat-associated protein